MGKREDGIGHVKAPGYAAKLRSNFMGTEFKIYDSGLNPKHKGANDINVRKELGAVYYESNLLGSKGPRKMQVLIPKVNGDVQEIWKPTNKDESLINCHKAGKKERMLAYINKAPKWNEALQAFVLNFNGRVLRPSVKNFQLISPEAESNVMVQFGRIDSNLFNMDVKYPFSIVQAFALCLTSLDFKLACE